MALISGGLAPVVGKIIDRVNPKYLTSAGLLLMAVALFWNSALMHPDTPMWLFLLPSALLGFANAGIWAPLSPRPPATCRRGRPGPVPASTTPPARSAPSSAAPPSPS